MKALLVVLLFLSSTSVFSKTVVSGNATATKRFELLSSPDSTNTVADTCDCKPSLPLEIGATSIIWGIPSYWLWRGLSDRDTSSYFDPRGGLIAPSLFLLMYTLGPIAEWTSGCEASYWHTLWIGLGTSFFSTLIYSAVYGFDHPLNIYKFNLPEYLAIGVVPAVASSFIFNLFLHPKEKRNHSFMIFPSVDRNNRASLNFIGRF